MKFPVIGPLTPRQYYGPALKGYREDPVFGSGAQRVPYSNLSQFAGLAKAGIGTLAIAGAGAIPIGGSNIFSRLYMPAIRGIEENSPGKILRTFQLSNILSQFETAGRASRLISPKTISRDIQLQRYLKTMTGHNFFLEEVYNRGLVYHKGSLFFGKSIEEATHGNFIGKAAVILNRAHSTNFSTAVARSMGLSGAFTKTFRKMSIVSAPTTAGVFYRQAAGYGAGLIGRFNKLSGHSINLRNIPFVGKKMAGFLQKRGLGLLSHMGVAEGPALKTLAKLTGKWTGVIGGLALTYGTADAVLGRFGPTRLAADVYAGTTLTTAGLSDITGLSTYRERQEAIAPGSTSRLKLAGFPMIGAVAGYAAHYIQGIGTQALRGIHEAKRLGRFRNPKLAGPATRWFHQLGRWLRSKDILGSAHLGPSGLKALLGAAVGAAVVAPFIPGAIASRKRRAELERIYSGEQEVPVMKSRWWEMGRTPWEGEFPEYYRPHWYALMKTNARDIAIYGRRRTPLGKFITSNFTYGLERKHYYDRPYPISGTAFEDVPFIGPLLAATVGRIFKPPMLMHTNEYRNGNEYMFRRSGFGQIRATQIGEVSPGAPINPYGIKSTISNMAHRLTEMIGLPGFMMKAIKGQITGEELPFSQETRLQSSYRMYGIERSFWDRELGGGGMVGEVIRRVFPHRERGTPEYNPIRNTMPSWLPGEDSHAIDFQHGDPYVKITMGEIRLPGAGYEALHPNLKGISPESYPDIYKLKILADIAPFSDEFKSTRGRVMGLRKREELSDTENQMLSTIVEQQRSRSQRKVFDEYKYDSMEHLSAYNRKLARKGQRPIGLMGALFGKYWETLAHGAETPFEYLTPISPAFKMIHMRSSLEDYARTQVFGTTNSFWTSPLRDFIKPFTTSTMNALGFHGIPKNLEHRRNIEEYFDILEYMKFTRLKNVARAAHDSNAASQFEGKTRETLFGINPYTMNFANVFHALPTRDRNYFQAFSEMSAESDREKVLALVPENERMLFRARWELEKAHDPKTSQADKRAIYNNMQFEGLPHDPSLLQQYNAGRMPGESYPDWYRRVILLPQVLADKGLPGPDFVGYHPAVDLEDVKLKLVQNMGEDIHDYALWPSQQQAIAYRPYINDDAVAQITEAGRLSPGEMRTKLTEILSGAGVENVSVSISMFPNHRPDYNINMDISQNREEDIKSAVERGI